MKHEIINYALKNLWQRKSRSFLTVFSILIGIASIFIFASFGIGLYSYVNSIAGDAGVDKFLIQSRGSGAPGVDDTFKLEDKDLQAVERTRGVSGATGMYSKPAQAESRNIKKYVFLAGMPHDAEDIAMIESLFNAKVTEGRQLAKGDKGKAVLGYNYRVADKIFPKPLSLNDKIFINGVRFEIIGFYEPIGNPQDDSNIYLLEEDFKSLYATAGYAMIVGQADDKNDIANTIERVKKELRSARHLDKGKEDFFVQSYEEALAMFKSVLAIIIGFIFLIVIISAVVASVNTANTMITSVLERIKEIGVMKSIGARNSSIRDIFLLESSIIGAAAGVLGVIVGWLLSFTGGVILGSLGWGFLSPSFPFYLFAACIILATLVGTLSGLAPALYASKKNPVDALRYE